MSLQSIIRQRSEAKELRLAGEHVRTKDEYIALGCEYLGSLGTAAKAGYYTPAQCERLGQPVTEEEWQDIRYFAMFKSCYQENTLHRGVGQPNARPCLPVFRRDPQKGGQANDL